MQVELARLLDRPHLPAGFERWRVIVEPGEERPTHGAEWAGTLVLVESGVLEVVCLAGGRHRFGTGDMLALELLPLRALANPGIVAVVLVAVRRSAGDGLWRGGLA